MFTWFLHWKSYTLDGYRSCILASASLLLFSSSFIDILLSQSPILGFLSPIFMWFYVCDTTHARCLIKFLIVFETFDSYLLQWWRHLNCRSCNLQLRPWFHQFRLLLLWNLIIQIIFLGISKCNCYLKTMASLDLYMVLLHVLHSFLTLILVIQRLILNALVRNLNMMISIFERCMIRLYMILSPVALLCAIGSTSFQNLWNRLKEQFSRDTRTSIF